LDPSVFGSCYGFELLLAALLNGPSLNFPPFLEDLMSASEVNVGRRAVGIDGLAVPRDERDFDIMPRRP